MLANCKQCRKPFNQTVSSVNICQECTQLREAQYRAVYRYITDHPETTIIAVVEETGVPEPLIIEFIKQGRIQFSSDVITCTQCQQLIAEPSINAVMKNGNTYCVTCIHKLSGRIQSNVNDSMDGSHTTHRNLGHDNRYGFGR